MQPSASSRMYTLGFLVFDISFWEKRYPVTSNPIPLQKTVLGCKHLHGSCKGNDGNLINSRITGPPTSRLKTHWIHGGLWLRFITDNFNGNRWEVLEVLRWCLAHNQLHLGVARNIPRVVKQTKLCELEIEKTTKTQHLSDLSIYECESFWVKHGISRTPKQIWFPFRFNMTFFAPDAKLRKRFWFRTWVQRWPRTLKETGVFLKHDWKIQVKKKNAVGKLWEKTQWENFVCKNKLWGFGLNMQV